MEIMMTSILLPGDLLARGSCKIVDSLGGGGVVKPEDPVPVLLRSVAVASDQWHKHQS